FKTLWMALNQKNYREYISLQDPAARKEMLDQLLRNNILSFYKGVDYWTNEKILTSVDAAPKRTRFKNQPMLAFTGHFTTNAVLPDYAGIGKSVARGFGTVMKIE
ncbi:MAG: CRISPR-associated endonuclease Cas6, partial [Chlorobi bacterium]|nr:CRISPR-associated endonuclease Cas6 [Chlorobiota bacterium]